MKVKTIALAAFLAGSIGISGCSSLTSHDRLLSWEEKQSEKIKNHEEEVEAANNSYNFLMTRKYFAEKRILPAGVPVPSKKEIEKAERKARKTWEEHVRLIEKVETKFDNYLIRNPDDYEAIDRLGHFYADKLMKPEAKEVWRELIKRNPGYASAYNNLGSLSDHGTIEDKIEAIKLFKKTIELAPKDFPDAYFNLAVYYSLFRKEVGKKYSWDMPRVFKEMIWAFGKARELSPGNAEYAREYANSFIMAKYFGVSGLEDESIKAWERYLAIDSLTPSERALGLTNAARVYLREKGDKQRAKSLLEQSIQIYPSTPARDMLRQCEER